MCVWFPMWSLTRRDAPANEPVLVVGERVTGATDEVLAAGVSLGMPRAEAEALAPFAAVLDRDPGDEARRFEQVAVAVENLVPGVEIAAPGLLFLPLSGAAAYYGGEGQVANQVAAEIKGLMAGRRGGQALVGVADGPFAARWAATMADAGEPLIVTDTPGFLAGLGLSTLRDVMREEVIDTFRWLGLSTLGDLARLPREAVASRFGDPGARAHRLASGEDRMVTTRVVPSDRSVWMSFEDPLETLEAVAHVGEVLGERLLKGMRLAGVAPQAVTITAEAADGSVRERVWRSADPFTERALVDRIRWQLEAWVDTAGVRGGMVRLGIDPSDLSGSGRQPGLFGDESSLADAERALARAQAMLGPDRVLQGRAQGGRLPSESVSWSRWGEAPVGTERDLEAPWPGATPSPSPALVPPDLEPIEVDWDDGLPSRLRLDTRWEPILTWSGPWRLQGRWWEGERDADRYQLVTSVGALLCVVVDGRSYLAGLYD